MISRVKRIAVFAILGLSLCLSNALAGGKDKDSFVDCKKSAPTAAAILNKMLNRWPVKGYPKPAGPDAGDGKSRASKDDRSVLSDDDARRLARDIERYGYDEQVRIHDIPNSSHPTPPPVAPARQQPVDPTFGWRDRNNLGLMYHQFVDGLVENAIDKIGFVRWAHPESAQVTITHRGLNLLSDWANGVDTAAVCVPSAVPQPAAAAAPAVAVASPLPVATVAAAATIDPAVERTAAAADSTKPKDWKPAKAPSWTTVIIPEELVLNGYAPQFYMRGSSAYLAQALGNTIIDGLDPTASDIPDSGGSETGASVAFHHDQLDHTANTFTMHLSMGFGFSPVRQDADDGGTDDQKASDSNWGFILPYISADRINKADPVMAKKNLTDLGIGAAVVYAWRTKKDLPALPFNEVRFSTRIQADTDDQFGASILYVAGQFSAVPDFLPCVTNWYPSKDSFIRFLCNYNVDLDYGHIFNAGDFLNLNQKEYARVGFDVSATIYGPNSDDIDSADMPSWQGIFMSLASRLSYSASYKALRDYSGNNSGLSRLETGLNFKLSSGDSGPSTSVALTYTNGRADVTLTAERYWEFSLKASF